MCCTISWLIAYYISDSQPMVSEVYKLNVAMFYWQLTLVLISTFPTDCFVLEISNGPQNGHLDLHFTHERLVQIYHKRIKLLLIHIFDRTVRHVLFKCPIKPQPVLLMKCTFMTNLRMEMRNVGNFSPLIFVRKHVWSLDVIKVILKMSCQ